ncbi:glycosyl transferase [Sulfuricella sp.]|uniref:glycosyl transferase n=1 Tax=Sulfuricella sp. TaxID=2099377 RepID=UPI002CD0BEA2|nr:glycosyl transferase [Sulfuricella sp.]HUX62985.1 glycosyl transferase [Sulfuricella sp.]
MTKPQLYAFTSAACNYLPKVRLLIQSLKRHHPEIRLVLALSDRLTDPELLRGEAWDEIMPIDTLDIPDWRRWAFTHDIVELSTAIKPFVLSRLLDRPDCGGVFYFDPDMVLFSRLDDLIGRLGESDILLTPHQNKPEVGLAQVIDNEICSLKHGIYNLGFIGVRPSSIGRAFARWWADRIYYFCRDDIPNGLFTDQRWIDLAPALFDGVEVIRSSRFNVAPWNLTTREMSGNLEEGFRVDGEPLGFYHFTGFDSGAHRIMTGKYCAANSSVSALVSWYEKETSGWRNDPLSRRPWAFGQFDDCAKIGRAHRLIFRSRADLQRRYPDPFAADHGDDETYAGWCRQRGSKEYPELLPTPLANADWSQVFGPLIPSIAPPAGALPPLAARLRSAATDMKQARLLGTQVLRVLRREGVRGLIVRIRRAMTRR